VSRLEDFNITLASKGAAVSIYVRGNCVAAVGETQGSTGLMTEKGLAYLVWHDGQPFLAAKGSETPAAPEEVEAIQNFSRDLAIALSAL
jgi:hypothetical protein